MFQYRTALLVENPYIFPASNAMQLLLAARLFFHHRLLLYASAPIFHQEKKKLDAALFLGTRNASGMSNEYGLVLPFFQPRL